MAHGPRKKRLDIGGNPDHVALGLGLRLVLYKTLSHQLNGSIKIYNEKSAQRDANTARAGCSKVRTPPARCHKPTDRTDYNTLHRS